MYYIGLDIGTTTVSGVMADDAGRELCRQTRRNTARIEMGDPRERLQDPETIVSICRATLEEFLGLAREVGGIGLTGQMHGIVYVDDKGDACSPLVTWQDERGNAPLDGATTFCDALTARTGEHVPTGYGLLTLFCDTLGGSVPAAAVGLCTIADYVAMKLTGRREPLVHASNAAGFGLYDLTNADFNADKISAAGLRRVLLPAVTAQETLVGHTPQGIPVAVAIGDNQASFLGAVSGDSRALINIGTGSQISVLSPRVEVCAGLECRPYIGGQYLLNGSALCGGSAYAALESFFRDTLRIFGAPCGENLFAQMDAAAQEALARGNDGLRADTRLRGTREEPSLRGSIGNIGVENCTPGDLACAVLRGICEELYGLYARMPDGVKDVGMFCAAGNGVRRSAVQQHILREVFGAPVCVPVYDEEAACGAALLAEHAVRGTDWRALRARIGCTPV